MLLTSYNLSLQDEEWPCFPKLYKCSSCPVPPSVNPTCSVHTRMFWVMKHSLRQRCQLQQIKACVCITMKWTLQKGSLLVIESWFCGKDRFLRTMRIIFQLRTFSGLCETSVQLLCIILFWGSFLSKNTYKCVYFNATVKWASGGNLLSTPDSVCFSYPQTEELRRGWQVTLNGNWSLKTRKQMLMDQAHALSSSKWSFWAHGSLGKALVVLTLKKTISSHT